MVVQQAGQVFVDSAAYADEGRLHEAFGALRRESPVHWAEAEGFNPFWAITKHADVAAIETNVAVFRVLDFGLKETWRPLSAPVDVIIARENQEDCH